MDKKEKGSESLVADVRAFDNLLSMIPSNFYYSQDAPQGETRPKGQGKKKEQKKVKPKKTTEEKQAMFNPEKHLDVVEVQKQKQQTGGVGNGKKTEKKSKNGASGKGTDKKTDGSVTVNELREKLHAKMAALQQKRKKDDEDGKPQPKKQKKDKEKKKKKEERHETKGKGNLHKGEMSDDDEEGEDDNDDDDEEEEEEEAPTHLETPIDLDFGSLKKAPKDPREGPKKKKVTKKDLLAKVEKFENKVKDLVNANDHDQAGEMLHSKAVSTALLRAKGIKVKDNKRLLKKSLKRDEVAKRKSTKEWKGRKKLEKEGQKKRQEKRNQNIKERQDQKKAKKMKKSKK